MLILELRAFNKICEKENVNIDSCHIVIDKLIFFFQKI